MGCHPGGDHPAAVAVGCREMAAWAKARASGAARLSPWSRLDFKHAKKNKYIPGSSQLAKSPSEEEGWVASPTQRLGGIHLLAESFYGAVTLCDVGLFFNF